MAGMLSFEAQSRNLRPLQVNARVLEEVECSQFGMHLRSVANVWEVFSEVRAFGVYTVLNNTISRNLQFIVYAISAILSLRTYALFMT